MNYSNKKKANEKNKHFNCRLNEEIITLLRIIYGMQQEDFCIIIRNLLSCSSVAENILEYLK